MNKRQKEVLDAGLKDEKSVLKALEDNYTKALADVKQSIKQLQANPLTQSKAYQLEYQKQLERQISGALDTLHGSNFASVSDYLAACYTNGFVGTMYDLQGQGVPLTIPMNQQQMVEAVSKTGNNIKLANMEGVSTAKLKKQVLAELQRGLATQRSYADIARNISNYGEADMNRAMRIARTEGHRVQNQAQITSLYQAREKGADVVKQWDSTLDGITRPTHQQLDGQVRELDENFTVGIKSAPYPGGFGDPAEDCNCRCAMLQRARWAVKDESTYQKWNNETSGIIECTGYADFKEKYLSAEAPAKINAFTPAKTIEEAEEYAKNFVELKYKSKYSGNISYKGISIENANKMNKVLTEAYEKYDVQKLNNLKPINFREAKWKNAVEDGVAAAYQWGNGGTIFINQKIFSSEKVTTAFIKKADDLLKTVMNGIDTLLSKPNLNAKQKTYIKALKKTGVQCVAQSVDDFAEASFVHEAGHALDDKIFRKLFKENNFDVPESMSKYAGSISGYAVSTNAEYVAESFTSYWYGKTDILDPSLVKIFEKAQKTSTAKVVVDHSAKNGIMSSVKFFTSESKEFETIILPKKEYAHVMSEIATNLTEEQKAKNIFSKAIGDNIYTVENNGFGDYRVIGKYEIPKNAVE